MSDDYCLIIRSNPTSPYSDVEGQSYHYKQTVANYTRIEEGVRFIMDRRDPDGIVIIGQGLFDAPEPEGQDKKGRKLYRANFKTFSYFPEPAVLTPALIKQIQGQERYNQQHSIRIITPQLFQDLAAFGQGDTPPRVLETFITELKNLRLGKVFGEQKLYKPLMLLAAARCLIRGDALTFDGPLPGLYRDFAEKAGFDGSRPEYPYYYLQSEGFWTVTDPAGKPLEKMDPPSPKKLRGSTVSFEQQRAAYIRNDTSRKAILAALLSHFTGEQQSALAQVWPDLKGAITISGGTRKKNALDNWVRDIHNYITNQGFHFTRAQIAGFYCALRTKPFVILAGISGTGKTWLPRLFAEAIGAEIRVEAVRPDWTDSADLIGYRDLNERFRPGRLLVFAAQAAKDPSRPHFFVLDEMNLARVEHYFADVLSKIESRRREAKRIVTDPLLAPEEISGPADNHETESEPEKYERVGLPDNLFIIGTVNMDETTHAFSRKVLDRAFTLEFSEVDLAHRKPRSKPGAIAAPEGFPVSTLQPIGLTLAELDDQGFGDACDHVIEMLIGLNKSLEKAQLQVGYRVRDEACLYACHAGEIPDLLPPDKAMDDILCAKILPRIQGGAFVLKEILLDLAELCLSGGHSMAETFRHLVLDVRQGDKPLRELITNGRPPLEAIRYPAALTKVLIMLDRLDRDGYTSYWL